MCFKLLNFLFLSDWIFVTNKQKKKKKTNLKINEINKLKIRRGRKFVVFCRREVTAHYIINIYMFFVVS